MLIELIATVDENVCVCGIWFNEVVQCILFLQQFKCHLSTTVTCLLFISYEIRRRKREERIKNTSELIAKMKHRQKASELWQSRERQLKPYAIGIFAAFAVGGYALYRYYWT